MKVIFAILICISGNSLLYAAEIKDKTLQQKHQLPSKGYYSIHKKGAIISEQKKNKTRNARPDITKGFYTIPSQQQLKQDRIFNNNKAIVTKGYYSIGKNREKLR